MYVCGGGKGGNGGEGEGGCRLMGASGRHHIVDPGDGLEIGDGLVAVLRHHRARTLRVDPGDGLEVGDGLVAKL